MSCRYSDKLTNWRQSKCKSTASIVCWCTCNSAQLFKWFCVIVVLIHVFRRRKVEKLRSEVAFEVGITNRILRRRSTSPKSPRVCSGSFANSEATLCKLRQLWRASIPLTMRSCSSRRSLSTYVYTLRHASQSGRPSEISASFSEAIDFRSSPSKIATLLYPLWSKRRSNSETTKSMASK